MTSQPDPSTLETRVRALAEQLEGARIRERRRGDDKWTDGRVSALAFAEEQVRALLPEVMVHCLCQDSGGVSWCPVHGDLCFRCTSKLEQGEPHDRLCTAEARKEARLGGGG